MTSSYLEHLSEIILALQFSSSRLLHVIEMNFEVLQHFLSSMMALVERIRTIYRDTRQLTTTVGRQSLEFGQSSLSTASEARSRIRQYPLTSFSLVCFCFLLLLQRYGQRLSRLSRRREATRSLSDAFVKALLDGAWSG